MYYTGDLRCMYNAWWWILQYSVETACQYINEWRCWCCHHDDRCQPQRYIALKYGLANVVCLTYGLMAVIGLTAWLWSWRRMKERQEKRGREINQDSWNTIIFPNLEHHVRCFESICVLRLPLHLAGEFICILNHCHSFFKWSEKLFEFICVPSILSLWLDTKHIDV